MGKRANGSEMKHRRRKTKRSSSTDVTRHPQGATTCRTRWDGDTVHTTADGDGDEEKETQNASEQKRRLFGTRDRHSLSPNLDNGSQR